LNIFGVHSKIDYLDRRKNKANHDFLDLLDFLDFSEVCIIGYLDRREILLLPSREKVGMRVTFSIRYLDRGKKQLADYE